MALGTVPALVPGIAAEAGREDEESPTEVVTLGLTNAERSMVQTTDQPAAQPMPTSAETKMVTQKESMEAMKSAREMRQ